MYKSFVRLGILAAAAVAGLALACSGTREPAWLDNGGRAAVETPEFFWATEVKRLALNFHPPEKRMIGANGQESASYEQQVTEAHAGDRSRAAAANKAIKEFEQYERGAEAYRQENYEEAARVWQEMLSWPKVERHYRSVWATFMLGKVALRQQQPEAVKWFQMTRQLAKEGFADTLGLAADSYGWEAKSELEQGNLEKAALLYLTQLALGDQSAIVSLKLLVGGQVGFVPMPPEGAGEAERAQYVKAMEAREAAGLIRAARDPWLRRITSAHILATSGGPYALGPDSQCQAWLKAIEDAKPAEVEDAAELGWVAYAAGDYQGAEGWLNLCKQGSATSLWLKSKLLRRDGKLAEATETMAQAVRMLRDDPLASTTGEGESRFIQIGEGRPAPTYSAGGDLGTLHLSRGDFIAALKAFVEGGLYEDAAFVAEHVLTADELKGYVDELPWSEDVAKQMDEVLVSEYYLTHQLRGMLARHLVRGKRYQEALPYLTPHFRKILTRYVEALKTAAKKDLPKKDRARAYFEAAAILRYHGMELIATSDEPFRLNRGYAFPPDTIALQRENSKVVEIQYQGEKPRPIAQPLKLHVPVTATEKKRLASSRMGPGKPRHYLYEAAAHGWNAAALLPNHSDELADVLNTCGRWIQNDARAADKFFQAMERRAWKTEIGKAAGARHWFVTTLGLWSAEIEPKY